MVGAIVFFPCLIGIELTFWKSALVILPLFPFILTALGKDIRTVGLDNPVELIPRKGDILFYHYFCAHAGSKNTSNRPRFAYNAKW